MRTICFVITSNIHYGRSKVILDELKKRKNIKLQIIVGGSAILPQYGDVLSLLERDGFSPSAKITMVFAGGDAVAMAKTTGAGVSEFATVFDNLSPDIVMIRGDRYEILSAAIAASYLNIPVAHIEGGDVTGTIDESVRHAVTKLSHIHFPTNEDARMRLLRMGEDPKLVFNVGSPEVEYIAKNSFSVSNKLINYLGVGDIIDMKKRFLMVMHHPVTSELDQLKKHTQSLLQAIYELKIPTIWFWPNVDAGTDAISKEIRTFREENNTNHMRFLKYVPPEQFIGLLKKTACLVGNSSSGIKEGSYTGTPVVNIGTRQNGRMRGGNVCDVSYSKRAIKNAIEHQLEHGSYSKDTMYVKPDTGKNIVDILMRVPLSVQKKFHS